MKASDIIGKLTIWTGPLFLGVFPVLAVYRHNMEEAEFFRIIIPLLYSLLFVFISGCITYVLFKEEQKASLLNSVWTILFFSYGYIYLTLDKIPFLRLAPLSLNQILLIIYALILFLIWFVLYQSKPPRQVLPIINLMAVFLVAINLAAIVPFNIKHIIISNKIKKIQARSLAALPAPATDSSSYPDIYFIVFDRYARQDILEDYFDFDNEPFLNYLESNGFYIARASNANYPHTFLSFSSSLNMSYLDFMTPFFNASPRDRLASYTNLIQNNIVVQYLKSIGYRYVLLGSYWNPTKTSDLADETVNLFVDFDELQLFIYEKTLFNALRGMFEDKQIFTGVEKMKRRIINLDHRLHYLEKKDSNPQPKFVFSHILMPHAPNLVSADCLPIDFDEINSYSAETLYLSELECANLVMEKITEKIKAQSQRPVVIIFQSDEGPFLPTQYFGPDDIITADKEEGKFIHSGILNAEYLSRSDNPTQPIDYNQIGLQPDGSPVNTFRSIFNYYFDTDLALLENKTYIYPDPSKPYTWEEITFKKENNID